MGILRLVILSVALGADLFSVAIGLGLNRLRWRRIIFASAVFAFFHIVLLLTGYHFGHVFTHFMDSIHTGEQGIVSFVATNWTKLLGGSVLIVLGLHMVKEYLTDSEEEGVTRNPLTGWSLIILAISVSIDALAAGFSLGVLGTELFLLCAILGVVIFLIAIAGLSLGRKLGTLVGQKAQFIGGVVLIVMGTNVIL